MRVLWAFIAVFAISFCQPAMVYAQNTTADIEETKELKKDSELVKDMEADLVSSIEKETPIEEQDQSPGDFLSQVLDAIKDFGGIPMVLQISVIIMLIISSMKVSLLRDLIWDRLGVLKAWVPPFLGLAAGLLGLAGDGSLTFAEAFAYMSAGAGAIILHELLNTIKAIPGLGKVYIQVIDLIQLALRPPSKRKS